MPKSNCDRVMDTFVELGITGPLTVRRVRDKSDAQIIRMIRDDATKAGWVLGDPVSSLTKIVRNGRVAEVWAMFYAYEAPEGVK